MDYPHDKLPYPLINKSRQQVQNFDTTDYFGGKLYTRKLFSEQPVTWDMTFQLNGPLRVVFLAWLSTVIINGSSEPFNMTIYCEDGPVEHSVTIVEAPLAPAQLSTGVWQYTMKVYAERLDQDAYLNNPDLSVDMIIEYYGDSALLSTIVNVDMPLI